MATILSFPPIQSPLLHRRQRPFSPPHHPYLKPPPFKTTLCSSTSLPTPYPTVAGDVSPPSEGEASPEAELAAASSDELQFRGCKTCGREEIEKGCNGEGRIQGGIATVPGFGWWPIKAFRPCPGFVASGGRYRRRGQSMDEVAFGRGERDALMESTTKAKSSKRKQGPKRFKG